MVLATEEPDVFCIEPSAKINGTLTVVGNTSASNVSVSSTLTTNNFTVSSTANLGSVSNLTITGGTANYVLSTNGSGVLSWVAQSGGSGVAGSKIGILHRRGASVETRVLTITTYPTGAQTATITLDGVAYTVSLTTSRGVFTSTGTTLTNNQAVPFNVTALSGSFASSSVPYWSLNQTFNWNATTTSGAANITYAPSTASGKHPVEGSTGVPRLKNADQIFFGK